MINRLCLYTIQLSFFVYLLSEYLIIVMEITSKKKDEEVV